jgi:hypothetical protein
LFSADPKEDLQTIEKNEMVDIRDGMKGGNTMIGGVN